MLITKLTDSSLNSNVTLSKHLSKLIKLKALYTER